MKTEIVTYNGIVSSGIFSHLGALGSSAFYYWSSGRLIDKRDHWANKKSPNASEIKNDVLRDEFETIAEENELSNNDFEAQRIKNNLRARKKRVMQAVYKIWNTTAAQRRFTAITLNFPSELRNDERLRVFNIILTRWRQKMFPNQPFVYMWVREVTKKGNYHYHMITTNFIDYNKAFELASETVKNACGRPLVRAGLYFDDILKKLKGNQPLDLANYISKLAQYVGKKEDANGRCFGCSRCVNMMFSSVVQECRFNDERRGECINIQVTADYEVEFFLRTDKFGRLARLVQLNDFVSRFCRAQELDNELDYVGFGESIFDDFFNGKGVFVPPLLS